MLTLISMAIAIIIVLAGLLLTSLPILLAGLGIGIISQFFIKGWEKQKTRNVPNGSAPVKVKFPMKGVLVTAFTTLAVVFVSNYFYPSIMDWNKKLDNPSQVSTNLIPEGWKESNETLFRTVEYNPRTGNATVAVYTANGTGSPIYTQTIIGQPSGFLRSAKLGEFPQNWVAIGRDRFIDISSVGKSDNKTVTRMIVRR